MTRWVPGYQTARSYRREWLRADIVAGLSLTAVMVPAGMAYAQAAGLPAVTGLYATVAPLLAYALFGPSRILVFGPDSALVALIASSVIPMSGGRPERAVALASLLALLAGAVCVLGGLARLGRIADLISTPMRWGYVNGLAVTVVVSQLPKLFGFSISATGVIPELAEWARGSAEGKAVIPAVAIGIGSLILILICRIWMPRVPGALLAVVLATVAVAGLGLGEQLPTVGPIPSGLPVPDFPAAGLDDVVRLLPAALAISLLSYTDTAVLSRTFAARGRYEVDANREMIALGVVNAASGFIRGFPVSSSGTRTPVAESAGAKTQLAGLITATVIVVLLVVGHGVLRDLPAATLAATVIVASLGLIEVRKVARLYRVDRPEFLLSVASFLAVVVVGVLPGIAIAAGLSIIDFMRHAWRPHDAVLARVHGMKGYHDLARHPEGRAVPGLVLFRWDAPLFFANAEFFRDRVRQLVADRSPVRWVVIAAEPITDVDSTAFDVLASLKDELHAAGIQLAFAELKGPVKDRLRRYGLAGIEFFPTVGSAVKAYIAKTETPWRDWEDTS
jgi:high affinity sulfate transporter 1